MKTLIFSIIAWLIVIILASYQNEHHNKPRWMKPTVQRHVLRMIGF